ncbi:acyl-CoA synthetase [Mycobacterium montefiorense]|uniref:Acyl-CoA synthetase n=1 Tax=Mycobacterium montefiorense TaxID=154654 RepID=A0AA37UXR7_9MYCO|nr:acyl-CoA synthetase [Mycobacterium montefiorense]GKU37596.1 acyl-CoA synthetase [Mycobacterium montefiorense]GKU41289.1 acyl-CoA synthetase [Mycobacterium montefiorense]GKU44488.1 acyl-CoA synthetase [Mycobacterium montefiorense]GKU52576.1 acyl-CoA synthetase [Mycobacterium montefiorense]
MPAGSRALHEWGFGARRERRELAAHESGQSHLGLYMANCNEFLEGMLGAYQARVAPFNVNYRYVADELVYLLGNAGADAVMYQARFAPTLAEALEKSQLPPMRLIHVDDDSGNGPLPGAVRYEELLASVSDEPLDLELSPDDLYVLYTGGTTGLPKAVLWRQSDIYLNAMGGRIFGTGEMVASLEEIVERSRADGPGSMTCAPLMHGAAQWAAFINLCGGRPFVMAPTTTHFDPAEALALASREGVVSLSIVGDAFGRPLVDALESGDYDLSGLLILVTGGAALSAPLKQRFVDLLPQLTILDAGGSSESGSQMGQVSSRAQGGSGRFAPNPGAVVVSEDMTRILSPGEDEIGWLAQQGLIPLGYLGDPEKTARTFPVIDGIRHSVPGDRARWFADGEIELLGRDSVTINSGGEKIFAEEVEAAIAEHPAVYDVVVTSRPSTRWGNEVVAVVALANGQQADPDSIIAEAARHLARYKLPKAVVFRDRLQRSPSGKADYRWAKAQVAQEN